MFHLKTGVTLAKVKWITVRRMTDNQTIKKKRGYGWHLALSVLDEPASIDRTNNGHSGQLLAEMNSVYGVYFSFYEDGCNAVTVRGHRLHNARQQTETTSQNPPSSAAAGA